MEIQGFQFVDVKRAHDNYRVFLKDSTFIGTYNEWEALLVAQAIERALTACHSSQCEVIEWGDQGVNGIPMSASARARNLL